jgi:hypothetical protein
MPPDLSRTELAWEFAELFSDFSTDDNNEMLAKNVPLETLEFFASYAESIALAEGTTGKAAEPDDRRLPDSNPRRPRAPGRRSRRVLRNPHRC